MARLWSSGFELNTTTTDVEWDSYAGGGSTATIDGTIKRSGDYSLKIDPTGDSSGTRYEYFASDSTGSLYTRIYFYVDTLPAGETTILRYGPSGPGTIAEIAINASGQLLLYQGATRTQQGSASSALSTDTWYRIELHIDNTGSAGSHTADARLDGSSFASSSSLTLNNHKQIVIGANRRITGTLETDSTCLFYFDDVAINDDSGSNQTSWPGAGSIVHMHPNAAGDNNDASAGDYTSVDEVTPDDSTTVATLDADNDILDVNLESSSSAGIGSGDTITLVQVGARFANTASGTSAFRTRIKSASSGTVTNGTSVSPSSTTYRTNANAAPFNYQLTSYTDPTTASAWTATGTNSLDNAQIGIEATDATPDVNVSTLWALVEYVPDNAQNVSMNAISATATLYQMSVQLNLPIDMNAISAAAVMYQMSVATGPVGVSMNHIDAAASLHQMSVAPGAVAVSMNAIPDGTTLYQMGVTEGGVTLVMNHLSAAATLYEPSVATGPVTVSMNAITATATLHNMAILPPVSTVAMLGISNPVVLYDLAVAFDVDLPLITASAVLYEMSVTPGLLRDAIGPTIIMLNSDEVIAL